MRHLGKYNPLCIWSKNSIFFQFPMLFDPTLKGNHRKVPAFQLPLGQGRVEKRPNAQRAKYIIPLFFLLWTNFVLAQNEKADYDLVRQKVENFAEQFEIEMDYSDFVDVLYYYYQHPLNLNAASDEQLRSLGLLNDMQIQSLLEYRSKHGNLATIYELKDVAGFDYLFVFQLKSFVSVGPVEKIEKVSVKTMLTRGRHDLILRYSRIPEEQFGFRDTTDSRFLGSPDRLYFRYRYTYRDKLSIALIGDKDAGEEFFKGSNKQGFDFYSGHISYKGEGLLQSVVLGDYHVEFGQGLTLWSGLGFGKSVDALGTQKGARGLRPNTSANEYLYMRGAAASLKPWEPLRVTLFYSQKKLDANADTEYESAEDEFFSSVQESGYHRTLTELDKEDAVDEQLMGGNVQFRKKRLQIGATAYYTRYDRYLLRNPALYKMYDFEGQDNVNSGIDFSWSHNRIGFFGEMAMSKNGGMAALAGMVADVHPRFKLSLLYRYYEPQYQVNYAVPFAESSGANNEEGLFLGMRAYLGKASSLNAYVDLFSFPWMRYRVDAPSQGKEVMLEYHYDINRRAHFYTRLRSETKMLNQSLASEVINVPTPVLRQSMRLNFKYEPLREWHLQSRFEVARYEHEPEAEKYGYLLFQDIKYRPEEQPFDVVFRYAIFNTDSYDTRLYAYESDVLYKFSIPGYYYKGQRYYLMLHWDVTRKIDFWIRFAQTVYFDRDVISSGNAEIEGNKKSEITAQLRVKF